MIQKKRTGKMLRAVTALAVATCTLWMTSCSDKPVIKVPIQAETGALLQALSTDKAAYKPGEDVKFHLTLKDAAEKGSILIRYMHMDRVVGEHKLKAEDDQLTWSWNPPQKDGKGYMAEVFLEKEGKLADHLNIAVDVSSDWGKFPRYGYLADFPAMKQEDMSRIIERLNRFHINGIQFYDWQYKHQEPVRLEGGKPAAGWNDIANRPVAFDTVKGYIELAHNRGMKAMNYNLLFGAYANAEEDGVKKEWGLYKDPQHTEQEKHPLPKEWASDIYLYDPSNPEWQDYLIAMEKQTFATLPFDGWQVDQLGNRGTLWTHDGKGTNLAATFPGFLQKAKEKLDVDYVMNAVGQYGQEFIALAPVKFLYTEVWGDHPQYLHLKEIIDENRKLGGNRLNTVLAAYMNNQRSNDPGEFNTPGILLTDAVIFASGGSHLELGENMLSKEYFPHKNLKISPYLEEQLVHYYDFLVAYQNLLRDNPVESGLTAEGEGNVSLSDQAEMGKVWSFAKQKDGKDVLHFINFSEATSMEWNDNLGTQAEPSEKRDIAVSVHTDKPVAKVWFASPDYYNGSPVSLEFKQQDGIVEWKLPKLKYWDMVVIEYK